MIDPVPEWPFVTVTTPSGVHALSPVAVEVSGQALSTCEEPRVFIVVEQLVNGHLLQVRKELSQNMLMRGNFSGDVMLVEIAAALRAVRGG